MEVDVAALKEGKKCADFLVIGDVINEGDESILHGHVVGIGFVNEANWRLWVNGMV